MPKKRAIRNPSKQDVRIRQLRDENKRLKLELRQSIAEFESVDRFAAAINSSLEAEAVLRLVLQKFLELTTCEGGAIFVTDVKAKLLRMNYHRNLPENILKKIGELSVEEGIGGLVSKTHQAQSFSLEHYPSYLPFRTVLKEMGVREVCFLPITLKESLLGMVLLLSWKQKPMPAVEMLSIAGRHAASAIANAVSYGNILGEEEQYRFPVESSNDVVYKASPDGKFVFVGGTIENLSGHAPKEFYRNSSLWLSLVHPDDKKFLLQRVAGLRNLGARVVNEYRVLPKGKAAYLWVRDVAVLKKDGRGDVSAVHGIISDITRYKETILNLQQSNAMQAGILESFQEGLVVYDRNLRCVRWNGIMERITGLENKKVLGKPASEIFPGKEGEERVLLIRRAFAGEEASFDGLGYRVPGSQVQKYFWERYTTLRDERDVVVGVVGLMTDMTERVHAERESRDSEQLLRKVIDTINDVLVITDLRGSILQVNNTFVTMLGYSRQEAIGRDFPYPWLVEEEMGRFVIWISSLRERSRLHDFDMTWKTKDGRMISMSLSTTLLRNSMGEPVAMLNLARDITERKQLSRELERRHQQVELINRVVGAANQTLAFDKIFTVVAKEIKGLIPCDEINVGLVSEDGTAISVYALSGPSRLAKGTRIPLERSLSQFAIRSHEPVIVSDFSQVAEYKNFVSLEKGWRSQISLPIQLEGKVIGTLNLGSREPSMFSLEHAAMLSPLAQHLGTIIDKIRLFAKVTEDVSYIRNLLDSIDSVVYTVDTQCRILQVNKAWFGFVREYGVKEKKNYHGMNLFEALPDESLKAVLRKAVPDLLSSASPVFSQEFVGEGAGGTRVFQVTINPLVVDRTVTGLVISHTDITSLKKTETELKRSNEQLLALNEISTLLNTSLKIDEIVNSALPLLKKIIGAEAVAHYITGSSGSDLVLAKQLGLDSLRFLPRVSRIGSATGSVISRRGPVFTEGHAYEDERIPVASRDGLKRENIESYAAIPLVTKDRVAGALVVLCKAANVFSPRLEQMLELIGNQFGAAVENAQLYEETLQKSREIELRNKELDDFTYVVSHDLKEPLISIEGFSKILQADYSEAIKGEGREYLESIAAATTRMKALINDLLTLSRAGRSAELARPVSIRRVIEDVKTDLEFTIRQKGAVISVEDNLPTVAGNETHLRIVFSNLLSNALKFNDKAVPKVEVGFQIEHNNYYLFFVKDNGIGIEQEFLERIFAIFERLHRREDYEGTGAGLAIVKKIIELQNGKIWAESELGTGSTFYFTIPKALNHD